MQTKANPSQGLFQETHWSPASRILWRLDSSRGLKCNHWLWLWYILTMWYFAPQLNGKLSGILSFNRYIYLLGKKVIPVLNILLEISCKQHYEEHSCGVHSWMSASSQSYDILITTLYKYLLSTFYQIVLPQWEFKGDSVVELQQFSF